MVSSGRDGIRSGRIPICIEASASLMERFEERTDANVAIARTSVPRAVASAATVVQSAVDIEITAGA